MTALFNLVHFIGATAQAQCGDGNRCDTGLPAVNVTGGSNSTLTTVLGIVFAVIGALAVLMIVIAGLRFVLAQGNPQETAKARNTIIYAALGLIISLAAEAFVAFVLGKL